MVRFRQTKHYIRESTLSFELLDGTILYHKYMALELSLLFLSNYTCCFFSSET